jgi:hypothetical protein
MVLTLDGILLLTKNLSENRRGLAHFAESSEQNVPVPLFTNGEHAGRRAVCYNGDHRQGRVRSSGPTNRMEQAPWIVEAFFRLWQEQV